MPAARLRRGDLSGEADEQHAAADAVHGLAGDRLLLDGHAEVEAELEQQLEEDVLLGAVGLRGVRRWSSSVSAEFVAVRLPCPDVAGVELEDAKAECRPHMVARLLILIAAVATLGKRLFA